VRTVNPSLLLLIMVWVALLLPGALRSRLRSSPRTTVGGFQRAMDGLRIDGRESSAPSLTNPAYGVQASRRREDPALVRRRRRFLGLVVVTMVAVGLAPVLGGAAWAVAAVTLGTTLVVVLVLRRLKLQRQAVRSVLVDLDLRRPAQPLIDEITGELIVAAGSAGTSVRLPGWGR
jgi:Flp pilus assembly protein TadB